MGKIDIGYSVIVWHPYPQTRPEETGSYLVCYESGGVNFGYYNHYEDENGQSLGSFSSYRRKIVAWAEKPKPYDREKE